MAQKPNSVVHVEIHSNAPETTKAFFKDVFGWKFHDMPEMNYSTWEAPSEPGGGLQRVQNMPAGVLDYILSDSIEKSLARIQSAGGAVMVPKSDIPGYGWFAVFQDPTGITMALYEALPKPRAAGRPKRKKAKARAKRGRGRKR
jgi:hypothetical protein